LDQSQDQAEGTSVSHPDVEPPMAVPNGLEQILETFGDIYKYVRPDGSLDPRWQVDFLAPVALPFPLVLSWDHSTSISRFLCHKLLTGRFKDIFDRVQAGRLQPKIESYGGCFAFRPKRTNTKLSTHIWGIAIDLNPETNAQGTAGDMDAGVIEIFRGAGFKWGGDWERQTRDPMHFQFCTGY
jgi:hypothetical protein